VINIYLMEESAGDTLTLSKDVVTCEGKTAVLYTDDEWQDIVWYDANNNQKGTGDTLHYRVTKDETLIATGHNSHGCFSNKRKLSESASQACRSTAMPSKS